MSTNKINNFEDVKLIYRQFLFSLYNKIKIVANDTSITEEERRAYFFLMFRLVHCMLANRIFPYHLDSKKQSIFNFEKFNSYIETRSLIQLKEEIEKLNKFYFNGNGL